MPGCRAVRGVRQTSEGLYVRGETDIFAYLKGELSKRIMFIDGAAGSGRGWGGGRRAAPLAACRAAWAVVGVRNRRVSRRPAYLCVPVRAAL